MKLILKPSEITAERPIGGKARALWRLGSTGLNIPGWIVVLPQAYEIWQSSTQQGLLEENLRSAVLSALPDAKVFAVRSSAIDEDGAEHSFAGQLDSFLFVQPDQLLEKIRAVWASGFSERMAAYRSERGLSLARQAPAVLIQRMIDAEAAGVAFGADPVSGRRGIAVISSVWGLGTALVGGDEDADVFRVDRMGTILERTIVEKKTAHRASREGSDGVMAESVPVHLQKESSLSDTQLLEVADLVRATGRHFGHPQDIEWAMKHDRIYLLQSRPITSLSNLADPDGALNLWDNSNIAESYNGVTTPLTFSFARGVYEEVYRQFCRIMGVREEKIADHRGTFRRMLGLIQGRIYYNLVSWYRVLALLPGFQINRPFMEQMMGVKEGLPAAILAEFESTPTLRARLRDSADLARTVLGLMRNHLVLPRTIDAFYARLNHALREPAIPLTEQRPDELAAHYLDLERQLLTRWDAPLINDFFAMIFYGILRKLCAKWCRDEDGTLQNDLISAEGGIISAEPAQRMRELGAIASRDPEFVRLLCDGTLDEIQNALGTQKEFATAYGSYLAKFGDRCLEELKLETATLHDDPITLLRSIGQMARRPLTGSSSLSAEMRTKAEARVKSDLQGKPLKAMLFQWVLRHARGRVRERENLRFERTRLFGRVRRIFVEIGKRFHAADRLTESRDIFYLTVDEILGFIDGTTVTADLKGLVAPRKIEFENYRTNAAPADRFETVGVVHDGNCFQASAPSNFDSTGDQAKGIGCCPGIVRGRARVVLDPRQAEIHDGEILVAPRTDPGWIMLFPSAAGLLVEYGSLLSHSAIVARELGLPAVVSITGLTSWLKTGDWVEFDGSTGIVRKIEEPKST